MKRATSALFVFLLILGMTSPALLQAMGPASGEQALADAARLVAMRPQFEVYRAQGDSMEPFFREDALLLVAETRWDELENGMIVLFEDAEGDMVAHQITKLRRNSAQTRGYNNRRADRDPLTAANLRGVVAGIFHTHGFDAAPDLPVALGKSDR